MGYTHYFHNKPAFTDSQWAAFCNDVRDILSKYSRILADGHGTKGTKPHIGRAEIAFNGRGENAHETCYIPKAEAEFEFCKTARKPYDPAVVEVYRLVRKYLPATELSSDGGNSVFGGQKIKVNDKWTYLTGDYVVAVGDTVLLPTGVKYRDDTWEGEVTSIDSDYTGDCKYILGVVAKAPVATAPVVKVADQFGYTGQISTEEAIAAMLNKDFSLDAEDAAAAAGWAMRIVAERLGVN